ncbi:MAG: PmeII family type II restriction endonuclease [Candidatus Binataceae bacterium]
MSQRISGGSLFQVLKEARRSFDPTEIGGLFMRVDQKRVEALASHLGAYIEANLPKAIENRSELADYRTNPYALITSAAVAKLKDPSRLAWFLFDSKLYMALETSFGKSVEAAFVSPYPIGRKQKWAEPPEKLAEFAALRGLSREDKAARRVGSVWREIDKSVVVGDRRYLTSIKSGPNTINDTQVQAMTQAIIDHREDWMRFTRKNHHVVTGIDLIIGLTYGTDRTTNNKENQILAKLLEHGFIEEDRSAKPGVLIDSKTRSFRIYRRIGQDFWAFIGNPTDPASASFVFLEILLGLTKALTGQKALDLEARISLKVKQLSRALAKLQFPSGSLPNWLEKDFTDEALFWLTAAMTAFYDEGI